MLDQTQVVGVLILILAVYVGWRHYAIEVVQFDDREHEVNLPRCPCCGGEKDPMADYCGRCSIYVEMEG